MYEIIDTHTKTRVGGLYKSRTRASARADRLSNEYGSYRYMYRKVEVCAP
jgi:hypothetical protein